MLPAGATWGGSAEAAVSHQSVRQAATVLSAGRKQRSVSKVLPSAEQAAQTPPCAAAGHSTGRSMLAPALSNQHNLVGHLDSRNSHKSHAKSENSSFWLWTLAGRHPWRQTLSGCRQEGIPGSRYFCPSIFELAATFYLDALLALI